jgi:hypothetical protein
VTKINEHFPVHPSVRQPTYRHASETARSSNGAGGEVAREMYSGKTPGGANATPTDQGKP